MKHPARWVGLLLAAMLLCVRTVHAQHDGPLHIVDDLGTRIELPSPARRIISLSPHITELLYTAGLGDSIVGAVSYSDYPLAARSLPRVGSYDHLDIERIASLHPDLVIAWREGNHPAQLEHLRRIGLQVFVHNPQELEDIAGSLEQFARLGNSRRTALEASRTFRERLHALAETHAEKPRMAVFYQVWNQPLMTVNEEHLISKVIRLCGGENVFAGLRTDTAAISVEAVLQARPQVIIASGMDEHRPEWLDAWRRWARLPAVQMGNLYFIPPDILQRYSTRILDGAEMLCEHLEQARINGTSR